MSRRSIYRTSRTNNAAYGPKTDSHVQHWRYDYIELATTREEESEAPQKGNAFRVKTWVKIDDSEYTPPDLGAENDTLELFNRIQAAADEIAHKEGELGASEVVETAVPTSVLPGPEEPKPKLATIEETKPKTVNLETEEPKSTVDGEPPKLTEISPPQPDESNFETKQNESAPLGTETVHDQNMDVDSEPVSESVTPSPAN